jgi:hypothetical protein
VRRSRCGLGRDSEFRSSSERRSLESDIEVAGQNATAVSNVMLSSVAKNSEVVRGVVVVVRGTSGDVRT